MTAGEKRKLLDAIEEVERVEGTDAALSPAAIVSTLRARFSPLLADLHDAIEEAFLLQFVAVRQGSTIRASRPHRDQLELPGLPPVPLTSKIRIPPTTKGGEPFSGKHHAHTPGRWVKYRDVPLSEFVLYVRAEEELAKKASAKRKERVANLRKIYEAAVAAVKGNLKIVFGEAFALAQKKAAKKTKAQGMRSLFEE